MEVTKIPCVHSMAGQTTLLFPCFLSILLRCRHCGVVAHLEPTSQIYEPYQLMSLKESDISVLGALCSTFAMMVEIHGFPES